MAKPVDIENAVLSLVLDALSSIGAPTSEWLTVPQAPLVGMPPADAVPSVEAGPLLYAHHAGTSPIPGEGGSMRHGYRMNISVWICSASPTLTNAALADVRKAMRATESIISGGPPLAPAGVRLLTDGEFVRMVDWQREGVDVGRQDYSVPFTITH